MSQLTRKTGKAKHIVFSWEKDLNPAQHIAVRTLEGPLMVLAGAGSGKTRVIACRIAHLAASGTVRADKILALTFTNKAASEMKKRVLSLINRSTLNLWMGTFHSVFARILRREAGVLGFSSHFTIYDEQDQLRALKDVIAQRNLPTGDYSLPELLRSISFLKSRLTGPNDYAGSAEESPKKTFLAPLYSAYRDYLKASNAMDFDDLLWYTYILFRDNPDILKSYQNRFKYILVDEFQDTNLAQYQILIQLASRHRNICVVGDDDQSIYRWRGAEIKNILQFEHDFPHTTVVRLEENYRSTKNILQAANSVIKNNTIRHDKTLWTKKETGEEITVHLADVDRDEAYWIVRSIESEVFKGKWNWGDFAVLYRLNAQSRLLEDNLRAANIPYVVVGGVRFYERKEVKDVLAYLNLIVNPDDVVSLKRIINYPHRGLGRQTLMKIETFAQEQGLTLFKALKRAGEIPGIPAKRIEAAVSFYKLIMTYRRLRNKVKMVELVSALTEEARITEQLQVESVHDSQNRLENVRELLRAIEEYSSNDPKGTLESYLSEIALLSDIDSWDDDHQHVSLMTVHSAKGLEFPVVYLTGLEEGILPIQSSLDDPEALEEERRLFYVGATRARDILHLSMSRTRSIFGEFSGRQPSRFLGEIGQDVPVSTSGGHIVPKRSFPHRMTRADLIPASALCEDSEYQIGMTVAHPDFGVGVIRNVRGAGRSTKLKILFEGNFLKNLLAEYAPLTIIGK